MGCVNSAFDREAAVNSRRIDASLKRESKNSESIIKILLLGAGESGKSTILKQMKILHDSGFDTDDCIRYKRIVYTNTVQSLCVILRAMTELGINYDSPETMILADTFLSESSANEDQIVDSSLYGVMSALWSDAGVQRCFACSHNYQLNDSAAYYLNALERISHISYVPTVDDILHTRVKTTGVCELVFNKHEHIFHIIDVGGQRSERKKWIHCFEGVTAIIFCAAISAYDLVLREDATTNRLCESLTLFQSVCDSPWFCKTSIILFLNKRDIFMEKIKTRPLSLCFPEYTGSNSFEEASQFIEEKFISLTRDSNKEIYTHVTCATDTNNIEIVFNDVTNTIMRKNLLCLGIL